jgi:hypothetical protein
LEYFVTVSMRCFSVQVVLTDEQGELSKLLVRSRAL